MMKRFLAAVLALSPITPASAALSPSAPLGDPTDFCPAPTEGQSSLAPELLNGGKAPAPNSDTAVCTKPDKSCPSAMPPKPQ